MATIVLGNPRVGLWVGSLMPWRRLGGLRSSPTLLDTIPFQGGALGVRALERGQYGPAGESSGKRWAMLQKGLSR